MDPKSVVGFVKQCMAKGLSRSETENLFRLYANNAVFTNPEIRKGAATVLDNYDGPLTKAAFAKVMRPSVLADIVEHTINEGKSAGAYAMRLQHPLHQHLTEEFNACREETRKSASFLQNIDSPSTRHAYNNFASLPLSQKLALMAGIGGTAGGIAGAFGHSESNQFGHDGPDVVRGALRGATLGAGALAGGVIGEGIGTLGNTRHPFMGKPQDHRLAQLAGAGAGAWATNKLINRL